MHYTIFKTPVINTVMRWISIVILRLIGWRLDGRAADLQKGVLIGAPHTSNWDFPIALMICFALRLDVYWMGKHTLFPPVLGTIMRWLGGIAVDRSQAGNLVQGTIDAFKNNEKLLVIVPPEGTRGKVTRWKTGFYYIAVGAGVPLGLGYLDFKEKIGGVGKLFYPSGNIEEDMHEIRAFYAEFKGKHPQQFDTGQTHLKR
ncbi:MAG: lysophospholipid acyltransferase family protein [Burkholderiales bacterium]|nr:lysophospholipid acyltransferase family protein [Burkholderiales bacterium]